MGCHESERHRELIPPGARMFRLKVEQCLETRGKDRVGNASGNEQHKLRSRMGGRLAHLTSKRWQVWLIPCWGAGGRRGQEGEPED